MTLPAQRLKDQSKDVNSTREQQFSVYVSGVNEDRMRQLQVLLLLLLLLLLLMMMMMMMLLIFISNPSPSSISLKLLISPKLIHPLFSPPCRST